MDVISIMSLVLLWVVIVVIAGILGFQSLSYKILKKIYMRTFMTNEQDKNKKSENSEKGESE